ncbi:hypothetical protein [Mucilaginibacter jinjuensis]|uniref:DUF4367 domain-containing protein n=1 Tax=Mucilaginibacter jinjuensis TaxID=1176721 RepID=A0ABY7T687_9SPHI|nr:hypothetical protein [Mucilaginibacter jinjuensis]WCT11861.1 hypothetical protein PQO05_24315 [Mucilaginibacter jinjuensis]
MLVSAFQKPEQHPLKVVTDANNAISDEQLLLAIARKAEAVNKPSAGKSEPALQVVETQQRADNFTITFSYAQQLHRTKVLRIGSGYKRPVYMYKVVLNSRLSNGEAKLCWLQQNEQNWDVLLGNNIDKTLLKAITTAIESME